MTIRKVSYITVPLAICLSLSLCAGLFNAEAQEVLEAPSAPTIDSVTASGTNGMVIEWTAGNDNGFPVIFWTVHYRITGSGASYTVAGNPLAAARMHTISSGLSPGTTYDFRVRGEAGTPGSLNHGDWSDVVTGTTDAVTAPDAPAAPTVAAITGSSTSLRITWVAPANNGATITGYNVRHKKQSETNYRQWSTAVTGLTTDITGLDPATLYQVQVRATNSAGSSSASAAGEGTTNAGAPDAPAAPTVSPVSGIPTSLRITWTAPANNGGATITGYSVRYKKQSETNYGQWSTAVTGLTIQLAGLEANTLYQVQVRATNSAGSSSASAAGEGTTGASTTVPGPPTITQVVALSTDRLRVTWMAPSNIGGEAITGYDVRHRVQGGPDGSWSDVGLVTTTVIPGLDPTTTYEVQVRARNIVGDGSASPAVTGRTLSPDDPTPPPPPVEKKKRKTIKLYTCPIGWQPWHAASQTQRAMIYSVEVDMDHSNPRGVFRVEAIEIYVDLDTDPESLAGWKLRMSALYNVAHIEYALTAENSEIIYFADPELGSFARIEVPEETPFPISDMGFIGQVLPGFDYRLFDADNVPVDFGISCYREGGLMTRLSAMQVPRVERKLKIADLDWRALFTEASGRCREGCRLRLLWSSRIW